MSIGDCPDCLKLLQDVTVASTRQMAAISRHAIAVQNAINAEETAELKNAVELCATERKDAVDRYRIHLLSHNAKASGAASGQL